MKARRPTRRGIGAIVNLTRIERGAADNEVTEQTYAVGDRPERRWFLFSYHAPAIHSRKSPSSTLDGSHFERLDLPFRRSLGGVPVGVAVGGQSADGQAGTPAVGHAFPQRIAVEVAVVGDVRADQRQGEGVKIDLEWRGGGSRLFLPCRHRLGAVRRRRR